MKDLLLFGIHCAGKGTQAALLSRRFGYLAANTGQLLREHMHNGTFLGKRIQPILDAGGFLPPDMIHEAFDGYFESLPQEKAIIADGMRTQAGADIWDNFISKSHRDFLAIFIEIGQEEAMRRTLERRKDGTRKDDHGSGVMRSRLQNFQNITIPVIISYEQAGKLIRINGEQSVEKVHTDIVSALEKAGAL